MRQKMGYGAAIVGAAALLALSEAGGLAQDKAGFVKQRQDFMGKQQDDVNAIGAFAKGQGGQADAKAKAADLVSLAPKIVGWFEGKSDTSTTDLPGVSRAKPEIWQSFDKFKALVPVLQGEETKLVAAIDSGDRVAVGAQLGAMYKNGCGACHTDYRGPKT